MMVRHALNGVQFEWDSSKALDNVTKHRVSFERAREVFFDPFLASLEDDFQGGEERQRVIGMTESWKLLYVVYVVRADIVRLISARNVTSLERKRYEDGYA